MRSSPCAARLADRASLLRQMPAGAARNALDCALWDLEAKRSGTPRRRARRACRRCSRSITAYTISLDTPEAMAAKAARAARTMPLLKLKLGGAGDAGAPAPGPRRLPRPRG